MIDLFTDPLIRGPFWASLLLSIILALIGVITFFAKKPLLGEVVSHCSYPGAILGLIISIMMTHVENPILILFVAFLLALCGTLVLRKIEQKQRSDSSMTLVLSGFFGFGVFLSSMVQQVAPKYYRLAQGYLFGQVATMTDVHILVYGVVLSLVLVSIYVLLPKLKISLLDPHQSEFLFGWKMTVFLETLLCVCLVVGIRGVGVVLVSSFFVAPALITIRFCKTFEASMLVACISAAILNIIAFYLPLKAPLGPVIVLLLSLSALFTLKKRNYVSL